MIELGARRARPSTRLSSSAARSCRAPSRALTPLLAREPRCGGRARGDDGADRQRAARRLPGQHQRDVDVPRPLGPLRAPVAGRQRDRARRRRRSPRSPRRRAEPHSFDGPRVRRGGDRHADRRRDRGQRDPRPRRVPRQLPLRPRPQRRRGRGAAARELCAGHGELRIDSQRAVRAGGRRQPARRRAASPPAALARRAQAGLDAGRRVRRWPALDAVNFGPGEPAQAHRRDESVAIAALVRALRGPGAVRAHEALPRARPACETYPFVRLTEAKRGGCSPRGVADRSTSASASRARRRRPSSARRSPTRSSRSRPTRAPRACRSCARRSPAGSSGASARRSTRHAGRADARLQGGDLPPRRRCSTASSSPCRRPAYPVYERGAVFAGKRGLELPLRAEHGFLPDLDAVPAGRPGRASRPLAQLPEQPDGARRPRSRSTSARPRWRASTTSCSPPTRRTRRSTSAASRPRPRCSSPTCATCSCFNTLSKRSSMPGYRSGFVAGDPELIALLKRYRPNVGVAPQAFVQRAAVGGLGRRGARRARCARATAPSATCCCRRSRAPRAAQRRRRRDVLPLARRRARRRRAGRAPARRRDRLAPGSFFGAAGAATCAGARADARRLRARRRAARPSCADQVRAPRGESR